MDQTLDVLPGEGEKRMQIRVRIECDECGEPAHLRHTYLLPGCRGNPASTAYGKDDCTWCADTERFTCKKCPKPTVDGYGWCATFPASARYAHMFLKWVDLED